MDRFKFRVWDKEQSCYLKSSPMLAKDVFTQAEDNGISNKTLKRAKKKIGIESYNEGFGGDKKWFWKLTVPDV